MSRSGLGLLRRLNRPKLGQMIVAEQTVVGTDPRAASAPPRVSWASLGRKASGL
jgi:hypothetical protein